MHIVILLIHEALVLCLAPIRLAATYAYGLWFLFRHPQQFREFAVEYRRYRDSIRANDELVESGYYHLNRADRRAVNRAARRVR